MPSLAQLLLAEKALLDETFGAGSYQLVETHEHACSVRTAIAEVSLAYDWRDQWVASDIKPLAVPERLQEMHSLETWLGFLDRRLPIRRKSGLDRRQVTDELLLIQVVAKEILADPERRRDAANFCRGYNEAYNDFYSGRWDTQG